MDTPLLPPQKGSEPLPPKKFSPCSLWPNSWMDQDSTSHGGRPQPRGLCIRWGPRPLPKKVTEPSKISARVYCGKRCMDQDGTWHGGRPQPMRLCARWGPSPPPPKRGKATSPIFGPFLLWPNGWMHQDATWYGNRPQPRGVCVRRGPSPLPKKGAEPPPQFLAHVCCGQTAGWIKTAFGMEVGLGPGHILLHGDPAPCSTLWPGPRPTSMPSAILIHPAVWPQ